MPLIGDGDDKGQKIFLAKGLPKKVSAQQF